MKCSGCQNDQWLGQDRGVILYVISNLRSNLIFTQTPRSITTGFFDFNNFTVECEERWQNYDQNGRGQCDDATGETKGLLARKVEEKV